jgi:phosphatidylserine/phosphatidylglycerophosphate/cardiolipin synthase-like enzyme
VRRERQRLDLAFKAMQVMPTDAQKWLDLAKPVNKIRFVHDTLGAKGDVFSQEDEFVRLIDEARTSVTLVSPYVHLQPYMIEAFQRAIARGVKIKIITASIKSTDAPMSSLGFEKQAVELGKEGIEIYQHQGPDLMHSKMMQVDGISTYVGSYNFNGRSYMQDLESGLVIEDSDYTSMMVNYMNEIQSESKSFQRSTGIYNRCMSELLNIGTKIPLLKHQI